MFGRYGFAIGLILQGAKDAADLPSARGVAGGVGRLIRLIGVDVLGRIDPGFCRKPLMGVQPLS